MSKAVLPAYFYEFMAEYATLKEVQERLPEDVLLAAYYRYAGTFKNRFTKDWFCIQPECEQYPDSPYGPEVRIQSGFLSGGRRCGDEGFGCFGSTDFGLGTELDYMDDVIRIHEMSDPVEKERKLIC